MGPLAGQPGVVVIQGEDGWRCYRRPLETIVATRLDDVPACVARLEAAAAAGLQAAGYLAYEAAPAFDPALVTRPPGPWPLLWFGVYEPAEPQPEPPPADGAWSVTEWSPNLTRAAYDEAIARIHEAIAAGETYQVNYTLRLRARLAGDAYAFATALWRSQRGRYGAWLDLGDTVLACASPELFFRLAGTRIESRPMKGTIARGRTPAEDADRAATLAASAKDQAENLMILDMIRNDLGRIARVGSVHVPERFALERYETVWQMTSTVAAETDASLGDILRALFPCASVTGAPKVQTMRHIAALEPEPRGVYCGAIGWLGPGRRACFNVAIRTVVVDRPTGRAEYGVGGGVVWDSSAEGEYDECRAKAAVLTRRRPAFDLLETLRWDPRFGYLLGERHLRRLAASAGYFGYPYDAEAVATALRPGDDWDGPRRVRLTLSEDGRVAVTAVPLAEARPRVWRVALAAEPVDSTEPLLYHKTTCRAVYDAARAAAPEADEVLLWNERGELTEGTITNLVCLLDGRLVTPPVACGLLAGTYRELVVERGWVSERVVRREDLARVEAMWLINSVRGWLEAVPPDVA